MSGLEALRVSVCSEPFWCAIKSLRALRMLMCVCKNIHFEGDVVLAVKVMKADRGITKLWAQRWLGLCSNWLTTVIADEFTLSMGLIIARQHGGLKKTHKRGIAMREKMSPSAQNAMKEIAMRRLFLFENADVFEEERKKLNVLLVLEGVPSGHFDAEIPTLDMQVDIDLAKRMAVRYKHFDNTLKINEERKRKLDEKLSENAALMCTSGSTYRYHITQSKAVIDTAMVRELIFRSQKHHNIGYDDIIEKLFEEKGFFYTGIHEDARKQFIKMIDGCEFRKRQGPHF